MSDIDVDDWEQRQVEQDEEDYRQHLMLRGTRYESNPESPSHNRNSQGEERYAARAFAAIPGNYGRNTRPPLRETADSRNTLEKQCLCGYSRHVEWQKREPPHYCPIHRSHPC